MLLSFTVLLPTVIFLYYLWRLGYWKRRKTFFVIDDPIFGIIKDVILQRKSITTVFQELYRKHKQHQIIGFYVLGKPMLLLTNTEIIKKVLISDFNSFSDNGFCIDASVDPMFGINPFCTKGLDEWKTVRKIQVPMQTTIKLKELVPQTIKVGKHLIEYILRNCSRPLDLKEVTSLYTIDNVTSCAFGFEPSAFTDPENAFKKYASTTLFEDGFLSNLASIFFPMIGKLLSLRIVTKEGQKVFVALIKKSLSTRKESNIFRNDLIDHLIKLNQKRIEDSHPEFTDLELAGHCFTFYLDGYETSSSMLSFVLLELSKSPEIQEHLRKEILLVGTEPDHFDFEKVQIITYLEMVVNESLRKHPALPVMSRICTKDIVLGNTNVSKGTKVFIPVDSLHKDPELYPEPNDFNPERFSEENKNSIVKCSYLPFGDGPRTCVGSKFALLQLKLAIIFILLKFRIYPEFEGSIEYDSTMAFVIVPKNGTKLRFDPLQEITKT